MKAKIVITVIEAHPEARYQHSEKFYTLVVDGVEICGGRESAFNGIRDAAFSLAHSASIILDNNMDGRDVQYA
jgi:hypothetical protein